MHPQPPRMQQRPVARLRIGRVIIAGVIAIALIMGAGWLLFSQDKFGKPTSGQSAGEQPSTKNGASEGDQDTTTAFNKTRYSLIDPTSPWVIVNKHRPLTPTDYAPPLATPNIPLRLDGSYPEMQVSTQIVGALEALVAAAKAEGLQLMLASGYRSYQQQVAVYNAEVQRNGQAAADRVSARPGHSEHQTGLVVDLGPASRECEIKECFGAMTEGKWLAANAYKYGFIIRYPEGSEPVTGYSYEPWHVRFVGKELAAELHKQENPLLENFFGLEAAPNYR